MKFVALALLCALAAACGDNIAPAAPDAFVDRCLACSPHSTCTVIAGAPCSCVAGYRGDGTVAGSGCADINECTAGPNACVIAHGTCTNTDGSFSCGCAAGFAGDGRTAGTGCTDIDECTAGGNNCVALTGTCTNTEGSFTCGCSGGFTGDGTTTGTGCTDIDECLIGTDDCVALHGTCANNDGSFTCGCDGGFTGDGTTTGTGCTDIDECVTDADNCVALHGTCTNNDGSFTCGCDAGFTGDGTTTGTGCTDIDECVTTTTDCDNFACVNTQGSFHCEGLYAIEPFAGVLARLDPATYQLLDLTTITSSGTVGGVTSMKRHPVTGTVYAFAKVTGVAGRTFGTLDLATSAFTVIASGDRFSSMDFLPDGTLYATTGDGASVPETLYTIDLATGTPTLVSALGNGADGDVICYNPDDQRMYHWSGNGTALMESFPLTLPLVFTNVSPNVATGEIFGCRYVGNSTFLTFDIASHVRLISTTGVVTQIPGVVATLFEDLRAALVTTMTVPHTVRPRSGDAVGGASVTIRGVGLTGATAVKFGAIDAASFTVVDDTTITAVTPAAPGGTVDVTATTPRPYPSTWPAGFTFVAADLGARSRQPAAAPIASPPARGTALQRKASRPNAPR